MSPLRSDISWPTKLSASSEHIHTSAFAGHCGGMCSDQSIWLMGLMPLALISTCICVATVPGDKPIARMPRIRASLSTQAVSIAAPALAAQ